MRKPSAWDPTGAWDFQTTGGIPRLMSVQTYYRPQPMSSILPRNSSFKAGGETWRKTRKAYAKNRPSKSRKKSLAKKIQNIPGKSIMPPKAKTPTKEVCNISGKKNQTPENKPQQLRTICPHHKLQWTLALPMSLV